MLTSSIFVLKHYTVFRKSSYSGQLLYKECNKQISKSINIRSHYYLGDILYIAWTIFNTGFGFMVFNATFNNISVIYRGSQFYWWKKREYPEKTTNLSQVTDKLYGSIFCIKYVCTEEYVLISILICMN